MAINAVIHKMNAAGLHATEELADGKWAHTPDYYKYRYGKPKAPERSEAAIPLKPTLRVVKVTSPFAALTRKLTPSERAQLIAMLEEV